MEKKVKKIKTEKNDITKIKSLQPSNRRPSDNGARHALEYSRSHVFGYLHIYTGTYLDKVRRLKKVIIRPLK